jgi:hypothetical protein
MNISNTVLRAVRAHEKDSKMAKALGLTLTDYRKQKAELAHTR